MKKIQVLIVEDEILVAETIKQSLIRNGYVVTGISISGDEAVRLADEKVPDVVIMDIVLKDEMNGIEAASVINKCHGTPVVFLSAHSSMEMFEKAKRVDKFIYITKPFEDDQIIDAIEKLANKDDSPAG